MLRMSNGLGSANASHLRAFKDSEGAKTSREPKGPGYQYMMIMMMMMLRIYSIQYKDEVCSCECVLERGHSLFGPGWLGCMPLVPCVICT